MINVTECPWASLLLLGGFPLLVDLLELLQVFAFQVHELPRSCVHFRLTAPHASHFLPYIFFKSNLPINRLSGPILYQYSHY